MQEQMGRHRIIVGLMALGALMLVLLSLEAASMVIPSASVTDFSTLVAQLEEGATAETPVTLYFKEPIAPETLQLTLPQINADGETLLEQTEIGSNYLCYRDARTADVLVRCIAFENIASITYPE